MGLNNSPASPTRDTDISNAISLPQKRNIRSIIPALAIILTVSAIVCYFSWVSPILDDDLGYSFNVKMNVTGTLQQVTSIWELFESQYYHYFYSNGRIVAHWLVQLYDCLLGQKAFAVSNGMVYALMILMLMRTCGVGLRNWKGALTVSCLTLICLCTRMIPAFQMYIWMYLLVLAYLWLLTHYNTRKWWMLTLLGVYSVICGNAHESLNAGVCIGMAVYFIYNRRINLQQIIMCACFCGGLAILILSPWTRLRMEEEAPFWIAEYRLLMVYELIKSLPALWVLIAVTAYRLMFRKEKIRELFRPNVLWWGIWAGCTAIDFYWGFMVTRAWLGEELAAMILAVRMLRGKTFTPFWLGILSVATVWFLTLQWMSVDKIRGYMEEIRRQAQASPDGKVYLNLHNDRIIAGRTLYGGQLWYMSQPRNKVYVSYLDIFSKFYGSQWGTTHTIHIYPAALRPYMEGKADTTNGNALIELTPESYLLVQNKKHPARFHVRYERVIPFFHKTYPVREIGIDDPIYEDDQWIATIKGKYHYNTNYPATFSMTAPTR